MMAARVVLRHHLRHPLAGGEGEAGREAEALAGIDDHLGGRVEAALRAVGAAQVEAHAGVVARQLQPLAVEGDGVVLARRELVVGLVAVGRARHDAEAHVGGVGLGAAVQLEGLVLGPEVGHTLPQPRRGAQARGEGVSPGVELLVEALEGAVHGQLRAAEAEVHVIALLDGVVDLPLEEVEGGDERLGAVLAPFLHHAAGDVVDVERALPHDAALAALVAGQVALVDADA